MRTQKSYLKGMPKQVRYAKRRKVRIPATIDSAISNNFRARSQKHQCPNASAYYARLALEGLKCLRCNQASIEDFLVDTTTGSIYNGRRNKHIQFDLRLIDYDYLVEFDTLVNISGVYSVQDAISICVMAGQATNNGDTTCATPFCL